jgi:homoserine dehydrogenase
MQSAEQPFAEALAEAQAAGYAEADPTEDVDGGDAAAKLAIVAAVGLRKPVRVADITRESIRPIDIVDFQYAKDIGCTIRQVARAAVQEDGRVFAVVGPALVPLNSSFGKASGSQNVVTVRGVFGGETSFSGSGAGGPDGRCRGLDLLSIRRRKTPRENGDDAGTATPVFDVSNDFVAPHYVRFTSRPPGILADIFAVFARHAINVEAVVQLPNAEGSPAVRGDPRSLLISSAQSGDDRDLEPRFPRRASARPADSALTS